jgi:nucleoid-associated protein YgaU
MLGRSYVVVEGDNLWKISKRNLGGGPQWPRIYRYNNRREVIAVTGRGIKNPDLIYVGQRLLLPIVPGGAVHPIS